MGKPAALFLCSRVGNGRNRGRPKYQGIPDLTAARQALLIKGFADLELDDYGVMLRMEDDAATAGYGVLN